MLDVDKDEKPLDGSLLKDYREALHVERTDMVIVIELFSDFHILF